MDPGTDVSAEPEVYVQWGPLYGDRASDLHRRGAGPRGGNWRRCGGQVAVGRGAVEDVCSLSGTHHCLSYEDAPERGRLGGSVG